MRPSVYWVRHGETVWNREGRVQGHLDSALTERGRMQAEHMGDLLLDALGAKPSCRLVTSPLGRALETAVIVAAKLQLPVEIDPRLVEMTMGSWDGLTRAEVETRWPDALAQATRHDWYFRSPDGEGFAALQARMGTWLRDQRVHTIAVSHGLCGKVLRGLYAGLGEEDTLSQSEPQDTVFVLEGGVIKRLPLAPPIPTGP